MNPSDNKKILINNIHQILKPLKFNRKALTWNRRVGDFIDVINVQRSQWSLDIAINMGVMYVNAYEKCWLKNISVFITEPNCTVRKRLGSLIYQKDVWWNLENLNHMLELPKLIENYGIPFLNSLHSLNALDLFLEKQFNKEAIGYLPDFIYLAAIKEDKEDIKGLKDLILKLRDKLTQDSVWKDAVEAMAKRNNI